jgi:hypothetical protein
MRRAACFTVFTAAACIHAQTLAPRSMAKDDRAVAEAVDKVLDKLIKRVEAWWTTESAREAKKAEKAAARAAAKEVKDAAKAAAKAEKAEVCMRVCCAGLGAWRQGWTRQGGQQQGPEQSALVRHLVPWRAAHTHLHACLCVSPACMRTG